MREKTTNKNSSQTKLQINSKILGLGPNFIVKVDIENVSDQPLYNLYIILTYSTEGVEVNKYPKEIKMLAPYTPYLK